MWRGIGGAYRPLAAALASYTSRRCDPSILRAMRLLELRLQTPYPDELRAFYTDTLELRRLPLAFEPGDRVTAHFAFNIPENQLAGGKRWLAERVELVSSDGVDEFEFEAWNAHAVYFRDPAGNIGELIARHNLPNASSTPFGPDSLLELSEVGLPVPDVASAVEFLERELVLALYDGNRSTFAAVGDEHGLFIVVREGRPWFTTDDAAQISPLHVTLCGERELELNVPGTPHTLTVVPG
jgi:catechol-2,3-dioxygenase